MIGAQRELTAQQIHSEMLEGADYGEALALERGIISLCRRQLFREKRDGTLDTIRVSLEENRADCDVRGVRVQREGAFEIGVSELGGGAEFAFDFFECGDVLRREFRSDRRLCAL